MFVFRSGFLPYFVQIFSISTTTVAIWPPRLYFLDCTVCTSHVSWTPCLSCILCWVSTYRNSSTHQNCPGSQPSHRTASPARNIDTCLRTLSNASDKPRLVLQHQWKQTVSNSRQRRRYTSRPHLWHLNGFHGSYLWDIDSIDSFLISSLKVSILIHRPNSLSLTQWSCNKHAKWMQIMVDAIFPTAQLKVPNPTRNTNTQYKDQPETTAKNNAFAALLLDPGLKILKSISK